jgi:hypothetical protein
VCSTGKTFLGSQFFRSPCDPKDSEKAIANKTPFSNKKKSLFTSDKSLGSFKQMRGGLRVFRLMLKPFGNKPHSVMDADLGCILTLLGGPLHHQL